MQVNFDDISDYLIPFLSYADFENLNDLVHYF